MLHFMFCPRQTKNNLQDFQIQSYIGIFMSQRERERKRESGSESVREREREKENSERERKEKEKQKERTNVQAIIFLNRLGQNEKSANYTVHGRGV